MSVPKKKRSKKAGLPPGTPIHIGKQRTDPIKVHSVCYNEASLEERDITDEISLSSSIENPLTWINVQGIHDIPPLKHLATHFDLHPLVLEDLVNTEQRPKVEDYPNYLFVVLKAITWDKTTHTLQPEQISLVLGQNFILSFQESHQDLWIPVRVRLQNLEGKLRTLGSDYLFYALIDTIVDHYFSVLEEFGEEIEHLEECVIEKTSPDSIKRLHGLKREMLLLRKSIWPFREVISHVSRGEISLIHQTTQIYLRDVYDHTVQVIETIETYRETLTGILELHLATLSNKLNEVMKVMAIIATVFIPLTLIAGIYGMNFKYMPELEWKWGYPMVLTVMVICVGGMLVFFRKRKWL